MHSVSVFVGKDLDADGIKNALTDTGENEIDGAEFDSVAASCIQASHDDRFEVHDVEIQDVTVDPQYQSQVTVGFEVSWSIYHGCKDMAQSDLEYESIVGTYDEDGYITFDVPDPRRPENPC